MSIGLWIMAFVRNRLNRRAGLAGHKVSTQLFLLSGLFASTLASEPLQLTGSISDRAVHLSWMGQALSYEVQSTLELSTPQWSTVLATTRTNAALAVSHNAAFFRVVPAETNRSTLVLSVTNEITGESVTFTNLLQPNADLLFNGPGDWGGTGLQAQMIFPAAERDKFDIEYIGDGGFNLITNAHSIGWGGWFTQNPGPGPSDLTYSGHLTNSAGVFTFSAVTDPAPGGDVLGGLVGAACWLYCLPGFAAQQLQCAGACSTKAIACAFQFKSVSCNFVTTIEGSGLLTNHIDCIANCQVGCK